MHEPYPQHREQHREREQDLYVLQHHEDGGEGGRGVTVSPRVLLGIRANAAPPRPSYTSDAANSVLPVLLIEFLPKRRGGRREDVPAHAPSELAQPPHAAAAGRPARHPAPVVRPPHDATGIVRVVDPPPPVEDNAAEAPRDVYTPKDALPHHGRPRREVEVRLVRAPGEGGEEYARRVKRGAVEQFEEGGVLGPSRPGRRRVGGGFAAAIAFDSVGRPSPLATGPAAITVPAASISSVAIVCICTLPLSSVSC